jgi:hypothetical protein
MRHRLAFFIILALVGSAAFTAGAMADTLQELVEPLPIILVERDVRIENAGIVFMNDTLTLKKPPPVEEGESYPGGELVFSEFWVGFHESFIDERRSFEVWQTDRWVPATYSEESEGEFHGYRIVLPTPVTLRDGVDLRIRVSYLFVNRVSSKVDRYEARIPVYPAILYNISSFALHAELPPQAQFMDVISPLNFTESASEETSVLDHVSEGIGPLSNVNASIQYVPSIEEEYLLDCQRIERHINIRQGDLRLEDVYTLINTGDWINTFHLRLPSDASDVRAVDGVGPLTASTREASGEADYIDCYVTPRSSFRAFDRWVFTISYSMPKGGYVTEGGGESRLSYRMDGFPHYVRELSAVVALPEGGSFIASEPGDSSTRRVDSLIEVQIELGASLPSERPEIAVVYKQSPLGPYLRVIALLLVVAGAFGSVYFLRRRGRAAEVKPVAVERPGLSDFLEKYGEKISLLQELDGMQKELDDGAISADEFNRRSVEINRRRGELARSLRQMGRDLEAEDPELRDRLAEIRRMEQELDRIDGDLRNLEVRLRARRVSRRDYERRREDRLRRRSQALKRIEQALASFGEG